MPYIAKEHREIVKDVGPISSGELNYAITMLCKEHVETLGLRYDTINEIIGALESAKLEFYRRVVVPYEDKKMIENGDVY